MLKILSRYVSRGDGLIVGVSGGPDSTALLDALAEARAEISCGEIFVAHVNHGIRGREADRDEKFVRALATKRGFPCEVKRVNLAGKTGQEERGRGIRRDFFERLRAKRGARWIVTAHTEDDHLETIVFNFLRGSGFAGLGGMKPVNGFFLKPLLGVSKAEILSYLESRALSFCRDRTNGDTRYRRNFIRHTLFPLFEKVNPGFRKTLLRNAEIFRNAEEWLEKEAGAFLAASPKNSRRRVFSSKDFLRLPAALQDAVLQLCYRRFTGQPYRLSSTRISEIRRLIGRNIGRKRILLPPHGECILEKGHVILRA